MNNYYVSFLLSVERMLGLSVKCAL